MLVASETREQAEALTALKALIDNGEYQPGDRLPPERELIVSLGMTRSTLRRALDRLEREGAIWRHVGKGTFVASTAEDALAPALADLIDRVSPANMMRARILLEPAIAREAAVNATRALVSEIRRCRDMARDAASWPDYEAYDDQFHRAIAQATGNLLLVSLFDHLNQVRRGVAWKSVVRDGARPPRDHNSFAEHDRILASIEQHDPVNSAAAMLDHLGSVSERLFRDR